MDASSSTAEVAERVGVQPGAVPRVEPVGDDVARLAGRRQRDDRRERVLERRPGGEHRVGRSARRRPRPRRGAPRTGSRRRTRRRSRQLGWPSPSSGIPCQRQSTVPSTTSQSSSRAPRCGQAPGPARAEPSRSRHSTTSRPATVRSRVRPTGTSADAAATSQPWVGRRSAAAQGGLDAGGLGVAPGAAQVVGRRLGEVAHRHAVAHLLAPGPVGAQQAHPATLLLRRAGARSFDDGTTPAPAPASAWVGEHAGQSASSSARGGTSS